MTEDHKKEERRWENEQQARDEIRALIAAYYRDFKKPEQKKPFARGERIPYAGRVYDEAEITALVDAALDFWLTSGQYAEAFEREFAARLGVRYAHLVGSGSAANLLAISVLTAPELGERRLLPGDEVITVACGFPTTIAPILQVGAVPVFVDVTIPQYNIDVTRLEEAYSPKTRAVFLAHTLGNPFDLEAVKAFCDKHDLWLIEDNCDALGSLATVAGEMRPTGAWGDLATSSFYPPHHITMGEGGCVVTSDPLLSRLLMSYRDWGRDCTCPPGQDNSCGRRYAGQYGTLPEGYDHKYVYSHFGYNCKATDLQAAIGCEQLKKLPAFVERRKHNWAHLRAALEDLQEILILPEAAPGSDPSWFGFLLTVRPESGLERDAITRHLEEANIQTRLLFAGNILRQPCFDALRGTEAYRVVGDLENTDYIMRNSFWVGVYPGLTDDHIEYIAEQIHAAVSAFRS